MSRGMVVGVSILISFGYFVWVFSVFLPWIPWWWTSPIGILNVIYLHFGVFMLAWSYYTTITTDPGTAQPHWIASVSDVPWQRPFASEEILSRAKEEALQAGKHHAPAIEGVRYCVRCKLYKPPRSHHCRQCQKCVLKLDHHCPWVNNCVGFYNHKAFVLFCFWCVWTIVHYHVFFVMRFWQLLRDPNEPATWLIVYIICFCVYIPTTLMIGSLLVWQLYILLSNRTTIEVTQEAKAARHLPESRKKNSSKHPYDLGMMSNLWDFFGPSLPLWLAPLGEPTGDGIRFRTNNAHFHMVEDA